MKINSTMLDWRLNIIQAIFWLTCDSRTADRRETKSLLTSSLTTIHSWSRWLASRDIINHLCFNDLVINKNNSCLKHCCQTQNQVLNIKCPEVSSQPGQGDDGCSFPMSDPQAKSNMKLNVKKRPSTEFNHADHSMKQHEKLRSCNFFPTSVMSLQ